jgi:hypothetical protein
MKRPGIHGAGMTSHGGGAAVLGAVENDWWDPNGEGLCVWAAYQPKGAASLAASYTDLSGNGNDAGVGVAPTWDAVNGWKFDGASQYLTTTFTPQNDQSQSMIVQYTNDSSSGCVAGMQQAADCRFDLFPNRTNLVIYGNGQNVNVAPGQVTGNVAVAGNQGYRNGVAEGAAIGAYGQVPAWPVWIGCRNASGVPAYLDTVNVQAFAIYDCVLTSAQVSAVATAMAAL